MKISETYWTSKKLTTNLYQKKVGINLLLIYVANSYNIGSYQIEINKCNNDTLTNFGL